VPGLPQPRLGHAQLCLGIGLSRLSRRHHAPCLTEAGLGCRRLALLGLHYFQARLQELLDQGHWRLFIQREVYGCLRRGEPPRVLSCAFEPLGGAAGDSHAASGAWIEASGHLEVAGRFGGVRRHFPYGRSDFLQLTLNLRRSSCYVCVNTPRS